MYKIDKVVTKLNLHISLYQFRVYDLPRWWLMMVVVSGIYIYCICNVQYKHKHQSPFLRDSPRYILKKSERFTLTHYIYYMYHVYDGDIHLIILIRKIKFFFISIQFYLKVCNVIPLALGFRHDSCFWHERHFKVISSIVDTKYLRQTNFKIWQPGGTKICQL